MWLALGCLVPARRRVSPGRFVGSLAFDALRVGWAAMVGHYRAGLKR